MAITIECGSDKAISREEIFDYVIRHVDPMDQASIISSAGKLKELANNRELLIVRFNEILKNYRAHDFSRVYSPHSFPLTLANESFMIRANIWTPMTTSDHRRRSLEEHLFAYKRPHDHNFHFLTVGYSGPGNGTDIYEYDYEQTSGYIGEKVELKFLERTSLPVGKIMFYRAGKDIHTQVPPEEISASLNLLVSTP